MSPLRQLLHDALAQRFAGQHPATLAGFDVVRRAAQGQRRPSSAATLASSGAVAGAQTYASTVRQRSLRVTRAHRPGGADAARAYGSEDAAARRAARSAGVRTSGVVAPAG